MFFGFPNPSKRMPGRTGFAAFTILELLVAMTILSLIVVVLVGVTGRMGELWRSSGSKIEQFRESRRAFEGITRRISTATLAPFLDYEYPGGDTSQPPIRYVRKSDLRFLSAPVSVAGITAVPANSHAIFFQAPLGFVDNRASYSGLEHLLNTWGYFVDYTGVTNPSDSGTTKYRFRLIEMREPSENLSVYRLTRGNDSYAAKTWFTIPAAVAANRRVLADNVIALIIRPTLSVADDPTGSALASDYQYDSTETRATVGINPKNQLPPLIEVIMVVLDEQSAARVCTGATAPDLGVSGTRFTQVGDLEKPKDDPGNLLERDLAALETALIDKNLNYEIFRTTLTLPGARWSTEQED